MYCWQLCGFSPTCFLILCFLRLFEVVLMLRYDRIAHNGVALRSCWIGPIREVAGSVRSGKLPDRSGPASCRTGKCCNLKFSYIENTCEPCVEDKSRAVIRALILRCGHRSLAPPGDPAPTTHSCPSGYDKSHFKLLM